MLWMVLINLIVSVIAHAFGFFDSALDANFKSIRWVLLVFFFFWEVYMENIVHEFVLIQSAWICNLNMGGSWLINW